MRHPDRLPVIESIYDPLSRLHDGTLTPRSPVLVQGRNFRQWPGCKVEFYLNPVEEPRKLIQIRTIYTYNDSTVVGILPMLPRGEYIPVMTVKDEEGNEETFRFANRWRVK